MRWQENYLTIYPFDIVLSTLCYFFHSHGLQLIVSAVTDLPSSFLHCGSVGKGLSLSGPINMLSRGFLPDQTVSENKFIRVPYSFLSGRKLAENFSWTHNWLQAKVFRNTFAICTNIDGAPFNTCTYVRMYGWESLQHRRRRQFCSGKCQFRLWYCFSSV